MLFELTRYHPRPRAQGAAAAVGVARAVLGDRDAGFWEPEGGAAGAPFFSLAVWEDFERRETMHAILKADTHWVARSAALRACEHWIVAPTAGAPENPVMQITDEVFEFRIQEVANGSQAAAGRSFWEVTAREVGRAGGRAAGQFDVVLGPDRPVFVTILAWPDYRAMHHGWKALDNSPECAAQRASELSSQGRPYFERPEQFLMRSMGR